MAPFMRCHIIDVSMSGVAVSAEIQPPTGTPLAIGACVGRVIRHFPNGFAVKFVKKQSRDELNRLVARTVLREGKSHRRPCETHRMRSPDGRRRRDPYRVIIEEARSQTLCELLS